MLLTASQSISFIVSHWSREKYWNSVKTTLKTIKFSIRFDFPIRGNSTRIYNADLPFSTCNNSRNDHINIIIICTRIYVVLRRHYNNIHEFKMYISCVWHFRVTADFVQSANERDEIKSRVYTYYIARTRGCIRIL